MGRLIVRLFWIVAIIGIIGCGSKSAPAVKPAATPPPLKAAVTEAPPPAAMKPDAVESPSKPPAESSPSADSAPAKSADHADDKPIEKPAEKVAPRPERIAVLTSGGPLLIDATITMDGQSQGEQFAARIQQVIDAGDTDHDHDSTWAELAANEEFLKAERALNPNKAKAREKAWTERFDLNHDKRIQSNEAAAWLGRDAGRSVTAFALRSRRSYYSVPALASRVWQLLDMNNDGRLSAEEIAAAPERFLTLDANDDRIITPPELAPLREQLNEAGRPAPTIGRNEDRYASLRLDPSANIGRLEYLLADLYAPRQPLAPDSFPDLPHLFEQLDANSDGGLDQDELAKLLTIKPHVDLAIAFDKPAEGSNRGAARIDVRSHAPEVAVVAQPATNRVVISLGNTRLILSANDLGQAASAGPTGPMGAAGERTVLRVMVHDDFDSLFEELDRNADGRLGEQEISVSPARMLARDKNGDGQLSGDEIPSAMIVAFLRSERPDDQSFYVPDDATAPLPTGAAPSWFIQADFNNDGAVSRREFLGSLDQFSRLDTNHDGFITPDEAAAIPTVDKNSPDVPH